MSFPELWIPGPTQVHEEVLEALRTAQIGHRAKEMRDLTQRCLPGTRAMFGTTGHVLFGTHSATGFMEAAVRSAVRGRILHVVNGAFSQRWYEISLACGREADAIELEWGRVPTADIVREHLQRGIAYDAFALVHNETSTGAIAPLAEIARCVHQHAPDALLLVDCVTSAAGTEIAFDAWGLDAAITGSQKALALPPGLALMAASERLLTRAAAVPNRGYYLDLLELAKHLEKDQMPTTPATPQLFALAHQLERIDATGGFEARFARHRALAERTRSWCDAHGFLPFPEAGALSPTVACRRTRDGLDLERFLGAMRERGYLLSNGYGKLKGQTFRIGHMGDHTLEGLDRMLAAADAVLAQL